MIVLHKWIAYKQLSCNMYDMENIFTSEILPFKIIIDISCNKVLWILFIKVNGL